MVPKDRKERRDRKVFRVRLDRLVLLVSTGVAHGPTLQRMPSTTLSRGEGRPIGQRLVRPQGRLLLLAPLLTLALTTLL